MFGTVDDRILVVALRERQPGTVDILLKLCTSRTAQGFTWGSAAIRITTYRMVQRFADSWPPRPAQPTHSHVEQEEGAGIKELAQLVHRPTCSTCGTIKRYQFNRAAVEQDYDVMATGSQSRRRSRPPARQCAALAGGVFGETRPHPACFGR